MTASRTIFIAGAGIGGLTAALALAARGFRIVVLERAARLEEAGAGLQLSPNASRVLIGLGLGQRLAAQAIIPEAISIASTQGGGEIARLPLGEAAASRAGAPYWVVHRAELQAALRAEVDDHPDIELRLGCQFEDVAGQDRELTVIQRRGTTSGQESALALIGADGIWSTVRQRLSPGTEPQFSGLIAWRGTLDARQLPQEHASRLVQLWLGPDAHLVAYPMSGARRINIVVVTEGTWNQPGWSTPGDAAEIRGIFASAAWTGPARTMADAVSSWRKWALFAVPGGIRWTNGATALLGDAAHAMLPFAAQGAATAIEDAAVLAQCLGETQNQDGPTIPAAMHRYAELRRQRVARIRRAARNAGRIYHLTGPFAYARDFAIRAIGGQRLLARQGWIHDWRL